jgi:GDPmannose 4,6-dehydratase
MVTQKIARQVACWYWGDESVLSLGNLQAKRDWGHSRDYVRAMHSMLQQEKPKDYVIGSGASSSVEEFLNLCIEAAGLSFDRYKALVEVDQRMVRENEIRWMCADASAAREELGWEPQYDLKGLAYDMVKAAKERSNLNIRKSEAADAVKASN